VQAHEGGRRGQRGQAESRVITTREEAMQSLCCAVSVCCVLCVVPWHGMHQLRRAAQWPAPCQRASQRARAGRRVGGTQLQQAATARARARTCLDTQIHLAVGQVLVHGQVVPSPAPSLQPSVSPACFLARPISPPARLSTCLFGRSPPHWHPHPHRLLSRPR
jgi:hypothetical protein